MKSINFDFTYIGYLDASAVGFVDSPEKYIRLFEGGKRIWLVARDVSFEFLVELVEKYHYSEITAVVEATEKLMTRWKKEIEGSGREKFRQKLFHYASERKITIYGVEWYPHLRHFTLIEKQDGSYIFATANLLRGRLKDTAFLIKDEKNTPLYFMFKNAVLEAVLKADPILPPNYRSPRSKLPAG